MKVKPLSGHVPVNSYCQKPENLKPVDFVYRPTRRRFLQAFGVVAGATILPFLLPSNTRAVEGSGVVPPHALRFTTPDQTDPGHKLVVIFMQGGLSFFDTFDPKQNSPYGIIQTASPDIRFSEILEPLAKHANNFVVINTLRGGNGFHDQGAALVLTSSSMVNGTAFYSPSIYTNPFVEFSNLLTNQGTGQAGYAVLHQNTNDVHGYNRSWVQPWDAVKHNDPVTIYAPYSERTGIFTSPIPVNTSISQEALNENFELLDVFNSGSNITGSSAERHDISYAQARNLLNGNFNSVYDLDREPASIKDLYGNSKVGRQFLTVRRLLEAGVRVVLANDGNYDHHRNMKGDMDAMLTPFAVALSALIEDINQRINEKTFIVIISEFGRTPYINNAHGRDHWVDAYGMVVISNDSDEINGGRTIGATNNSGRPIGRSYNASMVGDSIINLLKLGRYQTRGNVVTGIRFPYIDIKNENN